MYRYVIIAFLNGFMAFGLYGMDQSSSYSKPATLRCFHAPETAVTRPAFHETMSSYIHDSGIQRTIGQASTSTYSNQPDTLMVSLRAIQSSGDKPALESLKVEMQKQLDGAWFGKTALRAQLQKIESVCDSRMTQLFYIIKTGTKEQAEKALKEIRRLSPYIYAPQHMMPASGIYQRKLESHIKKSGFDELRVAQALYEKYHSSVRTTALPGEQLPFGMPELVTAITPKETGKTDMVLTTPSKEVNIHPIVDQKIEKELSAMDLYPNLDQHMGSIERHLSEMKQAGLLEVPIDLNQQAIAHGTHHFFKKMVPTNPLEHPAEFTINAIKYTALGAIHFYTGGVLLPVQAAAEVALKLQELHSIYTKNMTPNEYAELIAEQVADIAYTVATTKAASALGNAKIPKNYVKVGKEFFTSKGLGFFEEAFSKQREVVSTEGVIVKGPQIFEEINVLKNTAEKLNGGSTVGRKYNFKNGQYKDASYHTSKGNSTKSSCPIDGQHALDSSLPLPGNTDRRIAVSDNQFVVLDKTLADLYHGHIRSWEKLDDVMQAVLRKAGLVTKKGKIK